MSELDDYSTKKLLTLLPGVQGVFRAFLIEANRLAAADGLTVKLLSGTRTYAEQTALYNQGRTTKGPRVTNARAGFSNHNFGISGDVGVFRGKAYLGESEWYDKLGPVGESFGLEWGGRWKSIKDRPHYQFKTGLTTAQIRARVAAGKAILPDAPDRWTLYLNKTFLGDVFVSKVPTFPAAFSVRAILNRVFGRDLVDANLVYDKDLHQIRWGGDLISGSVVLHGGAACAPIRDVAQWLGLKLTTDEKTKTVTLTR